MVTVVQAGGFCVDCGRELSRRRYTRCRSCDASFKNRGRAFFRPTQVREMEPIEAAWVGALIEGEGFLGKLGSSHGYGIVVGSTSVETIATLLRLTGVGRVHHGAAASCNFPMWYWTIGVRNDILRLGPQILPFLTDKQDRLSDLLRSLGNGHS